MCQYHPSLLTKKLSLLINHFRIKVYRKSSLSIKKTASFCLVSIFKFMSQIIIKIPNWFVKKFLFYRTKNHHCNNINVVWYKRIVNFNYLQLFWIEWKVFFISFPIQKKNGKNFSWITKWKLKIVKCTQVFFEQLLSEWNDGFSLPTTWTFWTFYNLQL